MSCHASVGRRDDNIPYHHDNQPSAPRRGESGYFARLKLPFASQSWPRTRAAKLGYWSTCQQKCVRLICSSHGKFLHIFARRNNLARSAVDLPPLAQPAVQQPAPASISRCGLGCGARVQIDGRRTAGPGPEFSPKRCPYNNTVVLAGLLASGGSGVLSTAAQPHPPAQFLR